MTDERLELLQEIEEKAYIERQHSDKGQPLKVVKAVAEFLDSFEKILEQEEINKEHADIRVIFAERGTAYIDPLVSYQRMNISKLHKLQQDKIGEFLLDNIYSGDAESHGKEAKEGYDLDLTYQIKLKN